MRANELGRSEVKQISNGRDLARSNILHRTSNILLVGSSDWLDRFRRPHDDEQANQSSGDNPAWDDIWRIAGSRTSLCKINHETEGETVERAGDHCGPPSSIRHQGKALRSATRRPSAWPQKNLPFVAPWAQRKSPPIQSAKCSMTTTTMKFMRFNETEISHGRCCGKHTEGISKWSRWLYRLVRSFCGTHYEEMSHDNPVPPTTGPAGKSPMMDVATKAEGALG